VPFLGVSLLRHRVRFAGTRIGAAHRARNPRALDSWIDPPTSTPYDLGRRRDEFGLPGAGYIDWEQSDQRWHSCDGGGSVADKDMLDIARGSDAMFALIVVRCC
jgi:hypothetical protein